MVEGQPSNTASTPPAAEQRLRTGLNALFEARLYAVDLRCDAWDLAVELQTLQSQGVQSSDLRWMVLRGYVAHARESTARDQDGRAFERAGNLTFGPQSCFVLTDAGANVARSVLQEPSAVLLAESVLPADQTTRVAASHINGSPTEETLLPTWDPDRHQLRIGSVIVKEFKLSSRNQEAVLMAFEEEGWPPRIDDPLPHRHGLDPKQRLHNTIKSLNRNQRNRRLRFMGDGTGEAIRWELIPAFERNGAK